MASFSGLRNGDIFNKWRSDASQTQARKMAIGALKWKKIQKFLIEI